MYKLAKLVSIKRWSIQRRLLFFFTVLTTLPLITVGVVAFYRTYNDIQQKLAFYSTNMISQIGNNIESKLDKYNQVLKEIYTSQDFKYRYNNAKQLESTEKQLELYRLDEYLYKFMVPRQNIFSILMLPDGQLKYLQAGAYNPVLAYKRATTYQNAIKADGKTVWSKKNDVVDGYQESLSITASVAIKNIKNNTILGVLVMSFYEKELEGVYTVVQDNENNHILVADQDGTIVSNLNKVSIVERIEPHIMQRIKEVTAKNGSGYFNEDINGSNIMISCSYIQSSNWYVINMVPFSYLMNETTQTVGIIFIVIFVCILVAVWISYYVSQTIALPMKTILKKMSVVETGNFDVLIQDQYFDEFKSLVSGFNRMVTKIRDLVHEIYEMQMRKRSAELQALQAQINPHFLYNTLDSINWMANMIDADEIGLMVTSLARLFRLSLNKGNEVTSISNEIEHVKCYIIIQRKRFKNKFDVKFDVDPDILDCKTIKLILQPIVENSIYHGIELKNGMGNIYIRGHRLENVIKFEIEDDGIGIDKKRLAACLDQPSDQNPLTSGGYALRNVLERIKLAYGEEYGLTLESTLEVGTKVTVTIPYIEEVK